MQTRCWPRPALLPRIEDSGRTGGYGVRRSTPLFRLDGCAVHPSAFFLSVKPPRSRVRDGWRVSSFLPRNEAVGVGVVAASEHRGQGYNSSKIRALRTPWPQSAACLIRNAAWTTISPFLQDATPRVHALCGCARAAYGMYAGWCSVCWRRWPWAALGRRWRKKPTAPSR